MASPAMSTSLASLPPLPSPSAADYSERLSKRVLSSLRSLNESLGEVRRSVQKIDAVANSRQLRSAAAAQEPRSPPSATAAATSEAC